MIEITPFFLMRGINRDSKTSQYQVWNILFNLTIPVNIPVLYHRGPFWTTWMGPYVLWHLIGFGNGEPGRNWRLKFGYLFLWLILHMYIPWAGSPSSQNPFFMAYRWLRTSLLLLAWVIVLSLVISVSLIFSFVYSLLVNKFSLN